MKIALVDLCRQSDFAEHKSYKSSIDFLNEESINYVDFATGVKDLDSKVNLFHKAIDSDAELIWFVRGGVDCLKTINKINWSKVVESKKKFYGLSDFTHFSTIAVAKGLTCYYGQGLPYIKDFLPQKEDRQFIVNLLKEENIQYDPILEVGTESKNLSLLNENVVGGFLPGFILIQNKLQVNLKNSYIFIEYHSSVLGETLEDLGYLLSQLLYILNNNMPKGIILGHIELNNLDGTQISTQEINEYCLSKFKDISLPVYFTDHFKNIIRFNLN